MVNEFWKNKRCLNMTKIYDDIRKEWVVIEAGDCSCRDDCNLKDCGCGLCH